MELLGSYNSSLTNAYYQQLLGLLDAAISSGDLSGGSSFNQANLLALEQQAQSFALLPTGSAGSRVTDESFNYPLSLLLARLNALQAEVSAFTVVSGRLLDILANETTLIDYLLAADSLSQWTSTQPQIAGAWSTGWDFSTGQGSKSTVLDPLDPTTSVIYGSDLVVGSTLDCTGSSPVFTSGLRPPVSPVVFPFKNLSWTYPSGGAAQALYAPDLRWTQLDLLDDLPDIDFSAPPSVQVILPVGSSVSSVFHFVGEVPGGIIPTYVRVLFYPRLNNIQATVSKVGGVYVQISLSQYNIDPNSVAVISADDSKAWTLTTDYTTSQDGFMTPVDIPDDTVINVYFTEYWPAYQCSTDQINWSPVVMLDVNRLYPDNAIDFFPIDIKDGMFPVTDEVGISTGIYFTPLTILTVAYTLLVTTPPGTTFGPEVWLELDVSQPGYLNALQLEPYAAFPAILEEVDVEGLASAARVPVFTGLRLIDRPLNILFPRQVVSKIYLKFMQQNYSIKDYQSVAPDALRRNTMNSLEAILPFQIRNTTPSVPEILRGFEYEFGFDELAGLDSQPIIPGVFVQGPLTVPGCPDVIRLDLQTAGTVDVYLCYFAYDSAGNLLDSNTDGFAITSGAPVVFPFTSGVVLNNVASTEIDLRFVLRSVDAVVERYYLQATIH